MDLPSDELQEVLESLDTETRTLIAEVDLGEQAKDFVHSDLGRHLIGCLRQEVVSAQDALAATPFWKFWKVQEMQNRVWRGKFMLAWLRDLLIAGKSAQSVLDNDGE